MEETLQHKETTQCIGVSPTGTRSRNNHGSEADHAPTINLAQSDEAAQIVVEIPVTRIILLADMCLLTKLGGMKMALQMVSSA